MVGGGWWVVVRGGRIGEAEGRGKRGKKKNWRGKRGNRERKKLLARRWQKADQAPGREEMAKEVDFF